MANIFDEIEEKAARPSERNVFDQIEDGTFPPENGAPSSLGAFSREVLRSVAPGVGGTLAGAGTAALAASRTGRLAPIAVPIAAIAGGIAGGLGVRKTQDVVADQVAPESIMGTQSAQEDYEARPLASFSGSLLGMGKPSLWAVKGAARAVGTAEGRAGVSQVTKSLVNKDARSALAKASEEVDAVTGQLTDKAVKTRRAMEDLGHVVGSAAGFGTQTGMEIAHGEDPLTAAGKGLAGIAIRPWVGPGGVFLNPLRPPRTSLGGDEVARTPEEVPSDIATPEEQQLVADTLAGKTRAVDALNKAAESAEATGTLSQTAAALRQQAKRVARKPITPMPQRGPVDPVIEVAPAGPRVTAAARARAEKLGIDPAQVPPNRQGNVTVADVNRWQKANALTPEPLSAAADQPATTDVAEVPAPARKVPARPAAGERVSDEVLLEGVAQSKTKEEFVEWARKNGYGDVLRPRSGGIIGAANFWGLNRSASLEGSSAPSVETVVPEAPPVAPEAPPVAPEAPPVAPETVVPEAPPVAPEVVSPEVAAPEAAAPEAVAPKITEAPEVLPVVEPEPPAAPLPAPEMVDTSLEVFPMQGNRTFPGVQVQPISNVRAGLSLSPFRQRRFATAEEAERSLNDFDRTQLKDFYDRVHEKLGPGINESAKARTQITQSDALVNLADGFAAQALSRYSGASGMNWMKTIETLKAVRSGNPTDLFQQRSGGQAALFEIPTNTQQADYVNLRLNQMGIKGATLVKNPETGSVQVYVLVKNPSQTTTVLSALKRFAHENNYEKIRTYRGDAESVGADRESATAYLRESLGQYTGGGSRDRTGGPDRVRVARDLQLLAREAGIDLGELVPDYVPRDRKAIRASQYEADLAAQQEADAKIPPDKEAKYAALLTRTSNFLDRALGLPRLKLIELGKTEGRSEEEVFQRYVEALKERFGEGSLVPDVVQRRDYKDAPKGYGVEFTRGKPFPAYEGYQRAAEELRSIVLSKVRQKLGERVSEKPLLKRKTKENLVKIEAFDKQIEKLRKTKGKLSNKQKAELKDLEAKRAEALYQNNPWTMNDADFDGFVEGTLKNAVSGAVKRVGKNREALGLKEVEDTVLTGDDKENTSLLESMASEENADAVSVTPEAKRAAFDALRGEDTRRVDRVALVKKLSERGVLSEREMKALMPDIRRLEEELTLSDRTALKTNRTSARELGRRIADSYSLDDILRGAHRNDKGDLLLRPGENAAIPEVAEPPKVLADVNARVYLQTLLQRGGIASEDAAIIRQLLNEATLDNIPLRLYDYLPRGEYGSYNPRTGEIAINREMLGTPENNTETGLHEVGHALLRYFLDAKNSQSLTARQKKVVGDLNRLYQQTRDLAMREGLFGPEHLAATRNLGENLSLPTNQHQNAFRFSNVDEWTSAMMSNKEFREYMQGLETRDVVTGKLRSAWEAFKSLVARMFGLDRSIYKQSFDKIMELAADPSAGRVEAAGEGLYFRPGDSRSTRKLSTAKENENLAPEDQVSFGSQKVPQARLKAMEWISNGGKFEDLLNRNTPLSQPEVEHAAAMFRDTARAKKVALSKVADPSAKQIRERQIASDVERDATQLLVRMASVAGQVQAHGQHLNRETGLEVDDVIKTLMGKKEWERAEGKIDLQRMMAGIRDIKAKAADTTMSALSIELARAGITRTEDLQMLRDTLAHPSTTYKDLNNFLASLMPGGNPAKTRAMAERMYRLYATAASAVAKTELPVVVRDTYNGESIIPAGDKLLKKLNEFVKIGKYSEDEINATLLESLGLSGYDKDFIAGIRKDLDKVAIMPEGDMRNSASVEVLQKVRTKLYNNVLKAPLSTKEARGHVMDMLTSAWQSGVLSGPPTGFVNLLGSHASVWAESMMEATGYALKTGDARYVGDVFSGFLSALLGNKSSGRASAATAEAYAAMLGRGTKYRNAMREEMPHLENVDTTGTSAPVKLLAGYGRNLRWVGRTMTALDAVNMTMADEAKQRMVARFFLSEAKGHRSSEVADMMHKLFDPDIVTTTNARKQAEADVKTFLSNKSAREQERWITRRTLELLALQREELMPGIMETGKGAAERFTYNETARGVLGKYLVNFSAQVNQNIKAGRFIFSFMNTLANLMNQTLDYTPYGFLRAKNWSLGQRSIEAGNKYVARTYKEGSPEQMAQVARATLGSTVMMTLAYLAYKGYEAEENGEVPYFTVTGAGPKNPYDRQQLMDTGNWRPNSVKIGDTWYRYIDFPIIGAALGGVGTLLDTARYNKDEQTDGAAVLDASLAAATTVLDKQLLQGANNFFQVLRGGQPGQQVQSAKRLVGGIVGGYTNPGLARWIRNTFDMDSEGMVDRLDQTTTSGWIASMIPFSIGYNTPALNTLGEPIQQPWYSATTWRFADLNKSKPHPIITPLINAGLMLPNPSPATQFNYLDAAEGTIVTTRLGKHPEVLRRFVELRGQALKKVLTPEYIANLQRAAARDQASAQDHLDSDIGGAARKFAIAQIEQEIQDGKLKL
jgi:hypothetical protein